MNECMEISFASCIFAKHLEYAYFSQVLIMSKQHFYNQEKRGLGKIFTFYASSINEKENF